MADQQPAKRDRRLKSGTLKAGLKAYTEEMEERECRREELPDYPERAVTEAMTNAVIHRDYMRMWSEIHVGMYGDRLEI